MKRASAPGVLPLIPIDRQSSRPLHRQIYEGYRDAIVEGRLRAGERLPSTRGLGSELGVSRLPVLMAFEQLLAEGFVVGRPGSGTYVAHELPDAPVAMPKTARDRPRVPGARQTSRASHVLPALGPVSRSGAFRLSEPALEHFPFAAWSRLVGRHSARPRRSLLEYGDARGHRPLREVLASYLRAARGVRCEPDQILIVGGSQQALELCTRALVDPKDPVWLEEPGYAGARNAFMLAGARIVPVPVDSAGLDVDAGEARAPRPRLIYVTPSNQFPLGSTLTAARRLQLLELARRAGAWIVEDDYDSEYRYEGPPLAALQGLDRDDRVLYVGTFSKVLFPGLRLGYLVVPRDLVDRFVALRDAVDVFPPPFFQAVLADFISEGHFGRHLRRMRKVYASRRAALVEALEDQLSPPVEILGGPAGMQLVLALPEGTNDRELSGRCAGAGLITSPLSTYYLGATARSGLVLGFGGTSPERMREAVRRLRGVLSTLRTDARRRELRRS